MVVHMQGFNISSDTFYSTGKLSSPVLASSSPPCFSPLPRFPLPIPLLLGDFSLSGTLDPCRDRRVLISTSSFSRSRIFYKEGEGELARGKGKALFNTSNTHILSFSPPKYPPPLPHPLPLHRHCHRSKFLPDLRRPPNTEKENESPYSEASPYLEA